MSTTTATKTTATKTAKTSTPGNGQTANKKTEPKPEPKKYLAVGRSGQESVKTCAFEAKFAVDVKKTDARKPSYAAGVIVRFFSSKDSAEAFVAAVNDGSLAKRNDWYQGAQDAIITTAKAV